MYELRTVALLVMACVTAGAAAAQTLPSEPVTFGGGRVVLGGDVAVAMAPEDEGFFNYTDYEQTALRQFRVGMTALVRVTDRIAVLGELRSENLEHVSAAALYARIRPFSAGRFDIQIGRIPPAFGGLSRRAYGGDNPLIGYPLAYQYLTSLRADAVPGDADELLSMRGRGWLSSFTFGDPAAAPGVPLVSAFTWDTGIQATGGWEILTLTAGVTNGTASNPRVSDDNGGKQIVARLTVAPTTGLVVGASFARGAFLSRQVRRLLPAGSDQEYVQVARGLDVEYSRGHWVVRADAVLSEWQIPLPAHGPAPVALRALATAVEGRYTFLPGLYGAARAEHLGFNRVASATRTDTWEAPVTRLEVGGGYYLQRNLVARVSVQINAREGGRHTTARFVAGQLLYWF